MRSLPIILTALLIVVTDPYQDINYEQINAYYYDTECFEDCISYTESDEFQEEAEISANNDEIAIEQFVNTVRQVILLNRPVMQ